jgi:hypothetical protein
MSDYLGPVRVLHSYDLTMKDGTVVELQADAFTKDVPGLLIFSWNDQVAASFPREAVAKVCETKRVFP